MSRRAQGITALAIGAFGILLVGCSGESDSDVQARIHAVYAAPPNDVRADCLAAAIMRRAKDADVDAGHLATALAKTSSGTDPTLSQAEARVIADALTECPLPPPNAPTTTTVDAAPTSTAASTTQPTTPGG